MGHTENVFQNMVVNLFICQEHLRFYVLGDIGLLNDASRDFNCFANSSNIMLSTRRFEMMFLDLKWILRVASCRFHDAAAGWMGLQTNNSESIVNIRDFVCEAAHEAREVGGCPVEHHVRFGLSGGASEHHHVQGGAE
jgi:hypothetical protein